MKKQTKKMITSTAALLMFSTLILGGQAQATGKTETAATPLPLSITDSNLLFKNTEKATTSSAQLDKTKYWDGLGFYTFEGDNLVDGHLSSKTSTIKITKASTTNYSYRWEVIASNGMSVVGGGFATYATTSEVKVPKGALIAGQNYTLIVEEIDEWWGTGSQYHTLGYFDVKEGHSKPTINATGRVVQLNAPFDYMEGVTAFDDNGVDITSRVTHDSNVNVNKVGNYQVTYTVKDDNNMVATLTIGVVVIQTNQEPTLNVSDRTVKLGSTFDYMEGVAAYDQDSKDITNLVTHTGTVNTAVEGDYKVTYSVTDKNNMTTTKTVTITVKKDHSAPTLNVYDRTVKLNSVFDYMEGVTAFDDNGTNITSKVTYQGIVYTAKEGVYNLIYSVTDDNGLKTDKVVKITVEKDHTAPTLEVSDRTINVNSVFDYMEGVKATDEDGTDITKDVMYSGNVNTGLEGNYPVVYSITDKNGMTTRKTVTITVKKEHVAPTLNVTDRVVKLNSVFDYTEGITAFDEDGTDITNEIMFSGKVDTSTEGIYTVNYSVTDKNGLTTKKSVKITVEKEHIAPTLNATDRTVALNSVFDYMEGVTATDEDGTDITSEVMYSGKVDTAVAGDYKVTYTVFDKNNLMTRKIVTITVKKDHVAPTLTAADRTVDLNSTFDYMEGVTAKDEDGTDITGSVTYRGTVNTSVAKDYPVTYSVTDKNGLTTTKDVTITVEDNAVSIAKPELNPVTDKDLVVTGKGTPGMLIYVIIGGDTYRETVASDGTFSVKLDNTFVAGTAIEAYIEDDFGNQSEKVTATVESTQVVLDKPVLNAVTDVDTEITGTGVPGMDITVTIGTETYREKIAADGTFTIILEQPFAVGTAIDAYISDDLGNESEHVTASVISAELIVNVVYSTDIQVTGKTLPNTKVELSVNNTRAHIFSGKSDANGDFAVAMNNHSYPAGTEITVTTFLPTGKKSELVIVQPIEPRLEYITDGDKTVWGVVDPGATVTVTYQGTSYPALADEMGQFSVDVPDLKKGGIVETYQESNGVKSVVVSTVIL